MRFGALISGSTIDEIVDDVESHRRDGYTSAWLTDGLGYDPLSVLGIVGRAVGASSSGLQWSGRTLATLLSWRSRP